MHLMQDLRDKSDRSVHQSTVLLFTEASVALSGRVAVKNYISDSVDGILSNHILINPVIPSRQHLVARALFFSSDNVLKHTVCVLKAYPDRQKQCGIILAARST